MSRTGAAPRESVSAGACATGAPTWMPGSKAGQTVSARKRQPEMRGTVGLSARKYLTNAFAQDGKIRVEFPGIVILLSRRTTAAPCPVASCSDTGAHPYDDEDPKYIELGGDDSRTCRFETWRSPGAGEVAAEVHKSPDGVLLPPVVEIYATELQLTSSAAVIEFAAAVIRARNMAFGDLQAASDRTLADARAERARLRSLIAERESRMRVTVSR